MKKPLTFQDVHINAGLTGIGRSTSVIAIATERCIVNGEDTRDMLAANIDTLILIIVDHPLVVVPKHIEQPKQKHQLHQLFC